MNKHLEVLKTVFDVIDKGPFDESGSMADKPEIPENEWREHMKWWDEYWHWLKNTTTEYWQFIDYGKDI